MRIRTNAAIAAAILCLAASATWADLAPYSQDFEGLDIDNEAALAEDGWLVFGNVFNPDGGYLYGYGPFPAPNDGAAFCAIAAGQGGPPQGDQQLSVYSDYNNTDHENGNLIESNVFQEQTVGPADVGSTWRFEFDAKRGNIEGATTALAFFKTLDPSAGFALTNFIPLDMTNVPVEWGTYSLSITIDESLVGQIFQFGFLSTATNYEGSGVFYDNINFGVAPMGAYLDVKPGSCRNPLNGRSSGVLPVALVGSDTFDVDAVDPSTLLLMGVAPLRWSYDDVSTPFDGEACGCNAMGGDGFTDLTVKFRTRDVVEALGDGEVVTLTGLLLDGTPFEASDCVVLVGGGRVMEGPDDSDGSDESATMVERGK